MHCSRCHHFPNGNNRAAGVLLALDDPPRHAPLLPPQDFDPPSLAKLAFGLASVGYDDVNLYSAITQAASQDLSSMSPADVSMILWACGEQGHLCDRFMSGGWGQSSSLGRLQLCAAGQLCSTLLPPGAAGQCRTWLKTCS